MPGHDQDASGFPPVLTAAMAAELLCVHVEHLRRMVRDGKVPVHAFPDGRTLRFLRDELLDWLAAQSGPRTPPVTGQGAGSARAREASGYDEASRT